MIASAHTEGIAHPEERDLWEAAATGIAPRRRVRPSAWVARNITITARQSERTGPANPDYLPWVRDVLDVLYDEPGKIGLICVKPSQVGLSFAATMLMLCWAATDPGPMLYVTDTREKAADYANGLFASWIAGNPDLARMFDGEAEDVTHRELIFHKEFPGGFIDFLGAGTESGVTSQGRQRVVLDEYQLASGAFPKASGDLFVTAVGRTERYQSSSAVLAFGHPRHPDEDIDRLYRTVSDERSWVWDCPLCGATIAPDWSLVHVEGVLPAAGGESPRPDPATAVLRCPACQGAISDAQRARAVWPPRLGGTGRFESGLEPEERRRRRYVGLAIHRLSDPLASVRGLAERYAACASDAEKQSFYNKGLGETYSATRGLVTVDRVRERLTPAARIVLPGGVLGAHLLAAGVDVQAPESHPTLVTSVVGFAATGHAHVVAMEMLRGWASLFEYLRSFGVDRAIGDGGRGDRLGVQICGIDCGAFTKQVLDQCRLDLYSGVTSGRVTLLPLRYEKYVTDHQPYVLPREDKRVDPQRPWLGPQERYDLNRNHWVNRAMRRWIDGRISVLCEAPRDLLSHVTANTQTPHRDKFGYETGDMIWARAKNRVDDWLQSLAYAEAAAAIKLGLDRLHEIAAPPAPSTAERTTDRHSHWITGQRRSASWFGR